MRISQVTIVGGSGFVGRHIARLLAAGGVRVRRCARSSGPS
jgi:nucleoside-diphosphate-sugar epimerase